MSEEEKNTNTVVVYFRVFVEVPKDETDPGGYALAHYDPERVSYEEWEFWE